MKKLLVLAFSLTINPQSFSQTYAEIEKLLDNRDYSKAEALLESKIQVNAKDDSAYFFLGQIPVRARDEKKYDEAISNFQKCVELKPNSSAYHHWLGRAYGVKAQNSGVFSAMGYVGDIKSAFIKAIELDPKNFDARFDLIQFYLQAPGIAGGSTSKARDVANEHERIDTEQAKLLWVQIHLYEDEFDDAEAKLFSVRKSSNKEMVRYYRNSFVSLGYKLLAEEEPAKAQNVFHKFIAQFPELATGYHGLGRSLFDQKKYVQAIPQFEKAIAIEKSFGSQYRLGLIYEQTGEKQKAIKYLEEFIALRQGSNDKIVEEAKEHLADLKSNP